MVFQEIAPLLMLARELVREVLLLPHPLAAAKTFLISHANVNKGSGVPQCTFVLPTIVAVAHLHNQHSRAGALEDRNITTTDKLVVICSFFLTQLLLYDKQSLSHIWRVVQFLDLLPHFGRTG